MSCMLLFTIYYYFDYLYIYFLTRNSFVVELAIRYDATFGEWNLGYVFTIFFYCFFVNILSKFVTILMIYMHSCLFS